MAEFENTNPATLAPAVHSRRSKVVHFAVGLLLGAALLGWLLTEQSFHQARVWTTLGRDPLSVAVVALAAAAAQTTISTAKWHMLLMRASPGVARSAGWITLFVYMSASNAVSQVAPPYLAGPAVRGLALRARHSGRLAQQAVLAAYEQFFDVGVLILAGAVALAFLLAGSGGPAAVMVVAASVMVGCLVPYALPAWARPGQFAGLLPRRWSATRRMRDSLAAGAAANLDEPRLLGALMWLSALRYVALALRTAVLGSILLPAVSWDVVALGFCAVQLSALAALTPGNLGITELGWSAMAPFSAGTRAGDFVAFALTLRLSGLLASWLLLAMALACQRHASQRSPRDARDTGA